MYAETDVVVFVILREVTVQFMSRIVAFSRTLCYKKLKLKVTKTWTDVTTG